MQQLKAVLEVLMKDQLKLNLKNVSSTFFLVCLGHVIGNKDMTIYLDKMATIKDWP